jgi:hypothetical protein
MYLLISPGRVMSVYLLIEMTSENIDWALNRAQHSVKALLNLTAV